MPFTLWLAGLDIQREIIQRVTQNGGVKCFNRTWEDRLLDLPPSLRYSLIPGIPREQRLLRVGYGEPGFTWLDREPTTTTRSERHCGMRLGILS